MKGHGAEAQAEADLEGQTVAQAACGQHLQASEQLPLTSGRSWGWGKSVTLDSVTFYPSPFFMKKNIQKICEDIVKQYKQDENIVGILLFGSAARQKFDKYSDVDIYVLSNKKSEFTRSNFVRYGLRVDVIIDTIKEAESYLNEDKYNLRRITSHMIAHGIILFQKGRNVEKIQSLAKNNIILKTRYTRNEVLMHKYSIDDFWGEIQRDLQNNDQVAFGLDSHLLITNIIELFLKINGEFLKQPNEMQEMLKKLDKSFSKHVQSFYEAKDNQSKKRILANLIKYIYKKSGGSLPTKWSLVR